MSGFGNSYIVQHYSGHIQDLRDTLRRQPLSHTTFNGQGLPGDVSGNILQEEGYLKMFHAGIVLSGVEKTNAIRTTFYDTSGTPTGAERQLFTFISFCQKEVSETIGFTENDFTFHESGMYFQNGIGFITESLIGTPTIDDVDAIFTYVKYDDVYQ